MNIRVSTILFLAFTFFTASAPLVHARCVEVAENSLRYGRRSDGRCEGIDTVPVTPVGLEFTSLSSLASNNLSDTLLIQTPRISGNQEPKVSIFERDTVYKLDEIPFNLARNQYSYSLNTRILSAILRRASITNISTLRALARTSNARYVPVGIGGFGTEYKFVFFARKPAKFTRLSIKRNSTTYSEIRNSSFEEGEIDFSWDGNDRNGRMSPSGWYQIEYDVSIEFPQEVRTYPSEVIHFYHDENSLR